MKFSLMQSELQRVLHLVVSVVPSKSTLPILETVLVEVEADGALVLTATDLDMSVRARRKAEVVEKGKAAVAARRLFDVVRELPEQEVTVSGDESGLTLTCGSGRYRFVGAPVDDFPGLPEISGEKDVEIEPQKLQRMIRQTLYAVSTDETRPELTGVFLEVREKELRLVATNGHRLARAGLQGSFNARQNLLLPPKALNQLLRLMGDWNGTVEVSGAKNYARFRLGETQLYSRLLEGPFPEYDRVIPKTNPLSAVIRRDDLIASLRRILVLSDSQTRQVRMALSGKQLQVLAEYQGAGEAAEDIAVDYSGEAMTIGYNGGYLLEMLKTFEGERIEMRFQSAISAGLFRPADETAEETLLCLVMPLRLPEGA